MGKLLKELFIGSAYILYTVPFLVVGYIVGLIVVPTMAGFRASRRNIIKFGDNYVARNEKLTKEMEEVHGQLN
jgi:hypothetical protein